MNEKTETALERVLATHQRLAEQRVAEADAVSKEEGDRAAGDAMRSALEEYDRINPEPARTCAICGKHPASEPHRYDHGDFNFMSNHLDHVYMTFRR